MSNAKNIEVDSFDRGSGFLASRVESISVIIPDHEGTYCIGFRHRGGARTNPVNYAFAEAIHHPDWTEGGETSLSRQAIDNLLSQHNSSLPEVLALLCNLRVNSKPAK